MNNETQAQIAPAQRTLYRINASRFAEFEAKIARLNNKAIKFGYTPTTYTVGAQEIVWVDAKTGAQVPGPYDQSYINYDFNKIDRVVKKIVNVELSFGDALVKINGWELLGKIDRVEGGVLLSSIPGKEIPESYRSSKIECEHCQKSRTRKFTYVVRHESGETKQIGHQCLRDFLGQQSPMHIAAMAELLISFGKGEDFSTGANEHGFHIQDVLAITTAIARTVGWVSKQSVGKTPTTSLVLVQLDRDNLKPEQRVIPNSSDIELAGKIVAWLRSGVNTEGNSYLTNLVVAGASDFVSFRHVGLIASAYIAYDKTVGDPLKFQVAKVEMKNEHFGQLKERGEYDLTVVESREIHTDFGVSTMIKFLDNEKRLAVWFASGYKVDMFPVGSTMRVKATIKKHDSYKGLAQTILTRVTLISKVEAA